MSLYKRKGSPHWWVRFTHNGHRIQQSTGTEDKLKAQEYHDKLKSSLWSQARLGLKPSHTWNKAVVKWLQETGHKASHHSDVLMLRWLDRHLRDVPLESITRDMIARIAGVKAAEASEATANRHLALIRAILRKAVYDWEWIDKAPKVRMFKEPQRRVRWLTYAEAERLLKCLPEYMAEMARFALNTGLRRGNVFRLEWSQVDLQRRAAWIHPDQAKARKAIAVPLNEEAVNVIRRQIGKHHSRVFTYRGRPVKGIDNRTLKKALRKAGIENFRWHDLRHTFASWHVQAGTSIYELQELGGWQSSEMVRRYAHLAPEHLAQAAERIMPLGTKLATVTEQTEVN